MEEHFKKLVNVFESAPINIWFQPKLLIPKAGEAEVKVSVRSEFFHAGNATHGAIYFKMLDDAAYFAVQSLVTDFFILTASFTIFLLRPVLGGHLIARGHVVQNARRLFVAEAVLTNDKGKEVGRGSGTFLPSSTRLDSNPGYS